MDKIWLTSRKWSDPYIKGVQSFMDFVKEHMGPNSVVRCPCIDCLNLVFKPQNVVHDHLLIRGIDRNYDRWIYHGEISNFRNQNFLNESDDDGSNEDYVCIEEEEDDEMQELLDDVGHFVAHRGGDGNDDLGNSDTYFHKLINESQRELYPGCTKFSTLSFVIKLMHLKVYNKWTNRSFDMLLKLLKEALPSGETLPATHYEAKTLLQDLGLGYVSIHACKYDCALFWKEFDKLQDCPVCGTSRWKVNDGKGKKIPHKILRYFPLTPRLQRLFMTRKLAADMRWHKEKHLHEENILRHPVDSIAWQEFDREHPSFSQECRNVRLGLATDGFNPFGNMSNSYSMWPVILTPYNLPPWKCMKDPFLLMTLLIPGPLSPGKDIDIYLKPLVDELKMLWTDGVATYDISCDQVFQLHAAVLWTINDFPAYAYLSGWSTQGYLACPICNKDTCSYKLSNKLCYMGHRRYLPISHRWRRSKQFDGKTEYREPPHQLSGDDILQQLDSISHVILGKHPYNKKRKRTAEELNWCKKSIFFELPYWHKLKLRHNLDVMHIEKNICDNIMGTLLSIDGKTKDTIKARMDLEKMNIRRELHLSQQPNGSYIMPLACYTLSKKERIDFCQFLKTVKFPDCYASNIARCVNVKEGRISGMKTHDCHVMLQRILPIGIRGCLPKEVSTALAELGEFFSRLCSKTVNLDDVEQMEKDIALILCKLEMIYPPAFFDVMVHLPIHLPSELKLGGPIQFRWMYPIERFLGTLKRHVRNKAYPEGSIAEAYVVNEALSFCSLYLKGIETRYNRDERNIDFPIEGDLSIFSQTFRTFGGDKIYELQGEELNMMQWYILGNCDEVEPYIQMHMEELMMESTLHVEKRHKDQFPMWFRQKMMALYRKKDPQATESLYALACGPSTCVKRFTGCIVNGVRFHARERDSRRRTQNSGVVVEGNHGDNTIDFYGILNDILVLDFLKEKHVILFKCDWFNLGDKMTGIHREGSITSVNISSLWYNNDPFVLADQVRQVFYLNDPKLGKNWRVVVHVKHRHIFDIPEIEHGETEEDDLHHEQIGVYQEEIIARNEIVVDMDDHLGTILCREDIHPATIDRSLLVASSSKDRLLEDNFLISSDEEDATLAEYWSEDGADSSNEDSESNNID